MYPWQHGRNSWRSDKNHEGRNHADTRELKKGRIPGQNKVQAELLHYASERLIKDLQELIQEVWIKNLIFKEWQQTVQIPIPRNRSPQRTGDYRRISLCRAGYKIYIQPTCYNVLRTTHPRHPQPKLDSYKADQRMTIYLRPGGF